MNWDKSMKVGDLVKVTRSAVRGDYEEGIVLEIKKDTTYENVERYYVKYYSFKKGREETQWANHVEVVSRA